MKKLLFLFIALIAMSCNKRGNIENELNTFLEGQQDLFKFNGNVLVAEKGKIIYQKSFGFQDFDSNKMLNDSSIFDLASVNKQFTAMGILILMENGRLQLTDSLRYFFPELPYKGITIHQLLTHTSGLPDYLSNMIAKWDHSRVAFNNDMIKFLIKEKPPVYFAPGEKSDYSNTGYVMLGSIIEKVSGKSYGDFLTENIFRPLKMSHTYVYNARRSSNEKIPDYAYGYIFSDSLKKYIHPETLPEFQWLNYLDGTQGDRGVNTTAGDLFKWDRALRGNLLVSKETMQKMNTPYSVRDTVNKIYYGYGVLLGKDELGNFIMHSGGSPGVRNTFINYTTEDRTIIVLSNNESASIPLTNSLACLLFGRKIRMPYKHTAITIDSTALDKFTGMHKISGVPVKFIREKTHLFRYTPGARYGVEFLPESETKIFSANGSDMQYEFEKTTNGRTKLYRILYGVETEIDQTDLY